MSALRMMRNTCTISRKAEAIASNGYPGDTWSDTTGVQCAIQVASGREDMSHMRETGVKLYNCYFPYGTDIQAQDVLKSISGPSGIAANLRVTSPPMDHAGQNAYVMVTAVEEGGLGAA